jgi:hypothetical protein
MHGQTRFKFFKKFYIFGKRNNKNSTYLGRQIANKNYSHEEFESRLNSGNCFLLLLLIVVIISDKGKGKIRPRTGHEDPEGE